MLNVVNQEIADEEIEHSYYSYYLNENVKRVRKNRT